MADYSLAVALFDYLPVAVGALAYALLARGITGRDPGLGRWAAAAVCLILAGGLCKASWKLGIALTGSDWVWLDRLLFILVAPGMLILAGALALALRHRTGEPQSRRPRHRWLALLASLPWAGALLSLALWPGERYWFYWLLGLTSLANVALIVQAWRFAWRQRLPAWVGLALAYGLLAALGLGALARLPPGESAAWIQQTINLTVQASLALGFWPLAGALRASNGEGNAPPPS